MIMDRKSVTATLVSGAAASATALTFSAINAPSKIVRMIVTVPSFATTTTSATATVIDQDGAIVYQSASLAYATKTSIPVDIDVFAGDKLEVESSATVGNGANVVTVVLQLER
jgi:hypothetical protein